MTQPGNEYWCLGRTTCQSGVQSAASELVLIKLEVHWGVLHVSCAQTAALRRGIRRRLCAQSLPEADLSISPAFLCLWGDPCNPLLLIHLLSPPQRLYTHTLTHYIFSVGICYSPSFLHLSSFSFSTSSVTRWPRISFLFSSLSLPHSCCSPLLSLPVSCWLTLVFTASLAHLTSPLSLY